MTTPLVALTKPDVPWSRPDQSLIVGKDILELLSSSMYIDPMALYREYVQNAADSIDLAKAADANGYQGAVEIKIDANERAVLIRDDGAGLSEDDFVHRLTALGGSRKRGTGARGFRGVGRLAGLAFARELFFRSRQRGERTVHELRWSARDVREMLQSSEPRDLHAIVRDSVHTREISGHGFPARFFEVELKGVVRHRDDRLLNLDHVFNYLAQVAPVPFHPEFSFAEEITSSLHQHGIAVGTIDIEVAGMGKVYRPHRNAIPLGNSGTTTSTQLAIIPVPGRENGVAAVTWVIHSDYRGAIPSTSLVDGWRIRVGNIQVGSNDLLTPMFPEARFNSWCVAETHVLDPRLLPNGRRDHFEQNAYYADLINNLAPLARDIAQRCRASSIHRNLVRHIESGISSCDQRLNSLKRRALVDGSGVKVAEQLDRDLSRVQRLTMRPGIDADQQKIYQQQIKRLGQRLSRTATAAIGRTALAAFTPTQQTILSEVLQSIYATDPDPERSQLLVDRILKRVARALNRRR